MIKEKIYREIRNNIASGKFLPGVHLIENELSKVFGCSRGPIRDVFIRLEKEGFIELFPNKGAVITKSSLKDIEDYYSLLEILEGAAVELATPNLKKSDLDYLEKLNASMKKIAFKDKTKDNDWIEKWYALNVPFHRLFRINCGNQKMDWIVEEIRIRITRYRYMSYMSSVFDQYFRDHEHIIKAVRRKDALKAREAMEKHINRNKKNLMQLCAHLEVV